MINTLNSLRFLAFTGVFFHHLNYPGGVGSTCVTFFFILSGFVLAYKYSNEFKSLDVARVKKFYLKRLKNLYPIYFLTLLASIPITLYTKLVNENLLDAILNTFLLQSYLPRGIKIFSFNSVGWVISTEFFFYLAFPIIIFILNKLKVVNNPMRIGIIGLIIILLNLALSFYIGGSMHAYSFGWWFIYISPYFRVLDFITGIIIALIFKILALKVVVKIGSNLFSLLEFVAIGFFVVSYMLLPFFNQYPSITMGVYFVPALSFIIFIFAFQKGIFSNLLLNTYLVILGGASYEFFMIHQLVITATAILFQSNIYGYDKSFRHLLGQLVILSSVIIYGLLLKKYLNIFNFYKKFIKRRD